jgi:hypothetical protein
MAHQKKYFITNLNKVAPGSENQTYVVADQELKPEGHARQFKIEINWGTEPKYGHQITRD